MQVKFFQNTVNLESSHEPRHPQTNEITKDPTNDEENNGKHKIGHVGNNPRDQFLERARQSITPIL